MKDIVFSLLSPEELHDEYLMSCLAKLKPLEANPSYYSDFLEFFVHLQAGEEEARYYWEGIITNAIDLKASLGRPIGLRVAILDYFLNLNKVLTSPLLVEIHIFKEAERLAMIDSLTGLFNRRSFDIAIRKVAEALGRIMREEDSAYRYGGEEFAVLLPETAMEGAMAFSERMLVSLHEDEFLRPHGVTVSGGVAAYPYTGAKAEELIAGADKALYQAKAQGKNRFISADSLNKRRRPRFEQNWPLCCRRLEQTSLVAEGPYIRIKNVSLGGVGVELNEEYEIGDQVILDLGTPAGQLTVIGKIAWKEAHPDGIWSYGIEFRDLKSQQRQLMMKVLPSDYFDPGEVQR